MGMPIVSLVTINKGCFAGRIGKVVSPINSQTLLVKVRLVDGQEIIVKHTSLVNLDVDCVNMKITAVNSSN